MAVIHLAPCEVDVDSLGFDDKHINSESKHRVNERQARQWIRDAKISVTVWNGRYERYYGYDGTAYVDLPTRNIRTAYSVDQYDEKTRALMEVLQKNGIL